MKNTEGHVYVLISRICEHILIGGTDAVPFKRIREVNASGSYKVLGPWSLYDIRQVADWRRVEGSLHATFRSKLVKGVPGQKELFATSPAAEPLPWRLCSAIARACRRSWRWRRSRLTVRARSSAGRCSNDEIPPPRELPRADSRRPECRLLFRP